MRRGQHSCQVIGQMLDNTLQSDDIVWIDLRNANEFLSF
jgi:hypothetical protein